MKRILVTGGHGFIGSHLAQKLRGRGDTVAAPTRQELDITDEHAVRKYFEHAAPELILHLAADTRKGGEPAVDSEIVSTNLGGTQNVINAAGACGAGLVATGSFVEYGNAPTPFREDGPSEPLNTYGRSKLEATRLVCAYAAEYPAAVIRFPNVFGPGKRDDLVGRLIDAARSGGKIIVSKTVQRDYLYLDDAVAALIAAADHVVDCSGEVINACTGIAYTTYELAHVVEDIFGLPPDALVAAEEYVVTEGEQISNLGSWDKAQRLLNWAPRTSLSAAIKSML